MILHRLSCQSTVGKDGAVMGVTVTRMSMNLHTQVLSQACSYTEGIIIKLIAICCKSVMFALNLSVPVPVRNARIP